MDWPLVWLGLTLLCFAIGLGLVMGLFALSNLILSWFKHFEHNVFLGHDFIGKVKLIFFFVFDQWTVIWI